MAAKRHSTSPFIAKLLVPPAEGERVEDAAFDANDWIERLRRAGGSIHISPNGTIHMTIYPMDSGQLQIVAEAALCRTAKQDISAAIQARKTFDTIDHFLRCVEKYTQEMETCSDEIWGIKEHFREEFAQRVRDMGVPEHRIAAAMGGRAAQ